MANTINEEKYILSAVELAKKGDRQGAINILRQVIQQNPKNARAWYLLSQVVDEPEKKISCLMKVLEIDPGNTQAIDRLNKLKQPTVLPELNPEPVKQIYDEEKKKKDERKNQIYGIITLLVITALCLIIFSTCSNNGDDSSEKPDEPTETDAFIMCRLFVEDRLKAPRTAKFPASSTAKISQSNNRFTVSSYVDAENGFGALIRSDFLCVVEYQGDENWILKDIQIESR